ncbi:MAG: class I SAM-dependent methyltransferase, partial [Balneolales bacterium]
IYKKLAPIYDEVMFDVDYEEWADFIDEIIQYHRHDTISILELACGTGSVALLLDELDCYEITASDASADMIQVAEKKGKEANADVKWKQVDFLNINLTERYDAIIILFDSINYLTKPEQIEELLRQVGKVLKPQGIFIFDFTTPVYSQTIVSLLNEDRLTKNGYRYIRESSYDRERRLHQNKFTIQKLSQDKKQVISESQETHIQKIYTLREIQDIVSRSKFSILGAYQDFEMIAAGDKSGRVTMVTKCQETP